MSDLAHRLAGKFLVLDGPDGSGKSTQLARLKDHLTALGARVETVRDPGGSDVGDAIRKILLDRSTGRMGAMCETLLFMASRAQLIEERIRPALNAGKVVLCDRFVSATLAYQGAAGVDANVVLSLAESAVQGIWPDLTIILDVPVQVGMQRAGSRGDWSRSSEKSAKDQPSLFGDRLEARSESYHEAVRRNFRALPKEYPHPAVCIKGDRDVEAVFEDILAALEKAFPESAE